MVLPGRKFVVVDRIFEIFGDSGRQGPGRANNEVEQKLHSGRGNYKRKQQLRCRHVECELQQNSDQKTWHIVRSHRAGPRASDACRIYFLEFLRSADGRLLAFRFRLLETKSQDRGLQFGFTLRQK